jgi:hypothetical protein
LTPARRRFKTPVDVRELNSHNEPLKLGRRAHTDRSRGRETLADSRHAMTPRPRFFLARQQMAAVAGGSDAK